MRYPIGVHDLYLIEVLPNGPLQRQIPYLSASLIFSLAAILALGSALAFLLHRMIARPITALQSRIEAVGSGDFSADPAIEWDNELGDIGRGINKMSGNIIQTAKTTAAAGRYEDAINMLFAIPMNNKDFQTAQSLIAQYGSTSLNNKNMEVVRNARSTWSANPTEDGALEAKKTLENLNAPSAKVMTEVKKLQEEIAARLKAVSDREFRLEAKKVQNEKELEIATVNAVASVAKAYVANQPRVVYHCHWW